jgi:hypothetical protein
MQAASGNVQPATKLVKENELVSDRPSFRLPAALIFGGQLLFIAAGIFHPGSVPANDHPAVFAEYATSAYWGAVHMGQFVGLTVMLTGFIALAFALGIETGVAAWVGRFAAAGAVITVALMGVLHAVDGVALKAASDAWFAAPAAEQPARLGSRASDGWSGACEAISARCRASR